MSLRWRPISAIITVPIFKIMNRTHRRLWKYSSSTIQLPCMYQSSKWFLSFSYTGSAPMDTVYSFRFTIPTFVNEVWFRKRLWSVRWRKRQRWRATRDRWGRHGSVANQRKHPVTEYGSLSDREQCAERNNFWDQAHLWRRSIDHGLGLHPAAHVCIHHWSEKSETMRCRYNFQFSISKLHISKFSRNLVNAYVAVLNEWINTWRHLPDDSCSRRDDHCDDQRDDRHAEGEGVEQVWSDWG